MHQKGIKHGSEIAQVFAHRGPQRVGSTAGEDDPRVFAELPGLGASQPASQFNLPAAHAGGNRFLRRESDDGRGVSERARA